MDFFVNIVSTDVINRGKTMIQNATSYQIAVKTSGQKMYNSWDTLQRHLQSYPGIRQWTINYTPNYTETYFSLL